MDPPPFRVVAFVHTLRRTPQEIGEVVESRFRPLCIRFPPGGLEQGLVDFPTTLDEGWSPRS
jgi:hypothetical protein